MSDTSSDDDAYEDVEDDDASDDDTSDDDTKLDGDEDGDKSDESSDDNESSELSVESSDEDESTKEVADGQSVDSDEDSSDDSDDDAFLSHAKVNEDDVVDEEFEGDYYIKTIVDSDDELESDESSDEDQVTQVIVSPKSQPKKSAKRPQSSDTSSEDESSDEWFKGKYKTCTVASSDEDESEEEMTKLKVNKTKKADKLAEIKKKKPPPLTQEEIEIKKLIDSGDVDDKIEAELALRLMKELQCLKKHACDAASHCSTWTDAKARVEDLILKDEFIGMRVTERKAGIAVDLWKQSIVDSKKDAVELANRFSSVKEAVKHLNKEKENKKKLRSIQANYDLTSEEECVAVIGLLEEGHSEEDSVEAIKAAGIRGAEDYLEQLHLNQKTIRKLIANYELSQAQCLAVIELTKLKCDEELAVELIEAHDEKELAKTEWQRLMKIMKTPEISKKYKEVKKVVKFKKLVLALNLIEMGYGVKDVIMAAECCTSVNEALTIIDTRRECPCCCEIFTINNMITLTCQHEMCRVCTVRHFTERIREHSSVYNVVCPLDGCGDDQEMLDHEYFIMLANQLQVLLDKDTYDLFQTKLRDQITLKLDGFVYCNNCPNGFMCPPGLESATCPECKHVMCPKCRIDWEPNHKGKKCDELINLENEMVNEIEAKSLIGNKLVQNGIQCPKCKFQFELTRGGCMHFTCTQCKHEFCEGCSQEMFKGCKVFADCTNGGGLHGHHPRSCHYYMRDFSVALLESLFQMSNVEIPASRFNAHTGQCQLIVGDVTGAEQPCGELSNENHKGFCEKHYKEHLCFYINTHKLDPANVFNARELATELERNRKAVPAKVPGEVDDDYRKRLLETVIAEVPLNFKWKNRE